MRKKRIKVYKAACCSFILAYSAVVGALLAVMRDFVCNFFGAHNMELPAPTKFVTEYCYSSTGYSPYFTYVEIMLIAVFLIWIPVMVSQKTAKSCLLAAMCGFMGQTFFGALIALLILAPLDTLWQPELLNPPQTPTAAAVCIHYAAVASLVFALLVILRRWTKKRS
jgi:hypothetical protein